MFLLCFVVQEAQCIQTYLEDAVCSVEKKDVLQYCDSLLTLQQALCKTVPQLHRTQKLGLWDLVCC